MEMERIGEARSYFVDEAGDGVLFDRKGRLTLGKKGCSRFFILGLLDILDHELLGREMEALRKQLLADPYFRGVPSMQPEERKTAYAFHAKDDLPEVRREVFTLFQRHKMKFFAIVRDKLKVLDYVRQRNERDREYRYNPNELYDSLVRRLFKDRLHKDDSYNIYFAKRGHSDRTEALSEALELARRRFSEQRGITSNVLICVIPSTPRECFGLQAADYFLWALQRLYERREERFLQLLWPSVSLVHDVDDTRHQRYGVYYTQRNPLSLAGLKELPEI